MMFGVDNVFFATKTTERSVHIAHEMMALLHDDWGLDIKPDSKLIMRVRGASDPPGDLGDFVAAHTFPCLGFKLHENGSMWSEFLSTKEGAWKALWRNVRHSRRKMMSQRQRICTLLRAVYPSIDFRASRWLATPGFLLHVDRMQRAMFTQCMDISPHWHEDVSEFVRRRGHLASGLCRSHGLLSDRVKSRIKKCDAHVRRAASHPASNLLHYHGDEWLAAKRVELLPTITQGKFTSSAGRTGTRNSPGCVALRWNQSVQLACGHELG